MQVVFEGKACEDCIQVIANDEWSGIPDPDAHREAIEREALWELGDVVPGYGQEDFSTARCDYCGDDKAGVRHDIAVLR